MSQANLRKPAALWLAVTTLFGLAGTIVGLLPAVLIWGAFREGQVSLLTAMLTMIPYCSLMVCPLIAWWLLLRRRYALSLIVATPPILMWAISLILSRLI
ncbi:MULTISPECIES: hypothetical protein [unclassified Brevundimonas]|uniref:hypothetical protein n=1 Tax=unclassified Brevundimonas TaxID=2622653 RepID=UPI0025BD91C4|nr:MULTISPECIES: hypothetical protein [unclassified Brevundimonas]